MKAAGSLDGALLIDKPAGPTSHDVVDVVRGIFPGIKVGHAGTLDPNATGLLVVLLGRGTKLSEKLMGTDKVYEGVIRFGISTNTYDGAGEITQTRPVPPSLTLEELSRHGQAFVGDIMQTPPMVSAIKKDGVPLYKLARKGIEVERKQRLIHVYRFQFLDYEIPYAWFQVACTKGTYVRSLAHDLGETLGCGAYLSELRRTQSGELKAERAVELEALNHADIETIKRHVVPLATLVAMTTVG